MAILGTSFANITESEFFIDPIGLQISLLKKITTDK